MIDYVTSTLTTYSVMHDIALSVALKYITFITRWAITMDTLNYMVFLTHLLSSECYYHGALGKAPNAGNCVSPVQSNR